MTSRRSFHEQLENSWERTGTALCVGLDPRLDSLPNNMRAEKTSVLPFCQLVVEATKPYACAFKPNHAFFAALGLEDELAELIRFIHTNVPGTPVILDAKRGDIGATGTYYAREAFERYDADGVTVNPYLGWDTIEPFIEYGDRGVFVLCKTSNPGSAWLQNQPANQPIYKQIATQVSALNNPNLGLVAGATHVEELMAIRRLAPETTLLVPGVGAQGADPREVVAASRAKSGRGLLINVSRGITQQDTHKDFFDAISVSARSYVAAASFESRALS